MKENKIRKGINVGVTIDDEDVTVVVNGDHFYFQIGEDRVLSVTGEPAHEDFEAFLMEYMTTLDEELVPDVIPFVASFVEPYVLDGHVY